MSEKVHQDVVISRTDAMEFLQHSLLLSSEDVAVAQRSSLEALNMIIRAFQLKVPFQNVTLLSKSRRCISLPSETEMKDDIFQLRGGLCNTNNVTMKHLLAALGYECYHAAATCNTRHPNNHIVTIVTLLCGGDTADGKTTTVPYLVDVGCGYPMFQAIPLDFKGISPIYSSSFLDWRLQNTGYGNYVRYLSTGFKRSLSDVKDDCTEFSTWERLYDFSIIHRSLSYFTQPLLEVYQDRFLNKFRLVKYFEDKMEAIQETETGKTLKWLKLTRDCTKETVITEDYDVIFAVTTLCPSIDNELASSALRHWRQFTSSESTEDFYEETS